MSTRSWSASGRKGRPERPRTARPAESWPLAIERARAAWDRLTDGPRVRSGDAMGYSEAAAAAILSTALGLWADTAAQLADDDG